MSGVTTSADVAVSKTVDGVEAGAQSIYTITVSNAGPSDAAGIVVTDVLPAGVTFVSASNGGTNSSGTVTWPAISTLADGASQQFTLTVDVDAGTSGSLSNQATANSGTTPDPNATNNTTTLVSGIGANADVIDKAENRDRFKDLLNALESN